MAETKVYYHGTTIVDGSGPANPPPYTSGPPPGGYGVYPHPPGAYGPTIVTAQPTVVAAGVVPVMISQQMGPNPARVTCKSCNYEIVTRVESKATMRTHLFAALLCVLGCWPCVCIPYCMDGCMNTDHYCPNCNGYVGSYYT